MHLVAPPSQMLILIWRGNKRIPTMSNVLLQHSIDDRVRGRRVRRMVMGSGKVGES